MAIRISNLTVSNTAPAGTKIGLLTTTDASGTVIPCNYMLTKGAIGYFTIAGDNLVTAWTAPVTPGDYSVRLRAIGSNTTFKGSATFTVEAGTAAPPPPPPAVSPDGTTSTAPNGPALITTAGTWTWSSAASGRPNEYNANLNGVAAGVGVLMEVANSGQLYVGTANLGWFLWENNGFVASAGPVTPPPPPPPPSPTSPVITVTPNTPQLPDTTAPGAVVATYTVTMSDGSPFVGTIGFGPPNFDAGGIFALAGSPTSGNVIVNPSGPGVGPNLSTVTDHITLVATQP
jgi:hypothetical protein